jgi:hypothetical protein
MPGTHLPDLLGQLALAMTAHEEAQLAAASVRQRALEAENAALLRVLGALVAQSDALKASTP